MYRLFMIDTNQLDNLENIAIKMLSKNKQLATIISLSGKESHVVGVTKPVIIDNVIISYNPKLNSLNLTNWAVIDTIVMVNNKFVRRITPYFGLRDNDLLHINGKIFVVKL